MKHLIQIAVAVAVVVGGFAFWKMNQQPSLPEGIVSGNGRIEATQTDVATKYAGRITDISVKEGDLVHPGQVLVKMDTSEQEAQLANAQAKVKEAEANLATADANIEQAQADTEVARSDVDKSQSALTLAEKNMARADELVVQRAMSKEDHDRRVAELDVSKSNLKAARDRIRASEAALGAAKTRRVAAEKQIDAYTADVKVVQTQIDDMTLRAPVQGRVLYRLKEKGETLPAGGAVLTLVNLDDIYMTIYIPSQDASRVDTGGEARIVLDAAPEYAVPARVTFVAPEAQFTPKQVETKSERDKLMFRVKLSIPPELVQKYIEQIKTGIRGMGYVRTNKSVAWPAFLETKIPAPRS